MTTVNVSEDFSWADSASVIVQSQTVASPKAPYVFNIPGSIPGKFSSLSKSSSSSTYSFHMNFSGQIPGPIPGLFNDLSPTKIAYNAVSGVGWEASVTDGVSMTLLALVPRYYNLSFSKEWSGEGSGQIVIDRQDPIFNLMTMSQGAGTDIVNKENIITVYYEGSPVFEFLATSIDETQVDATTEQQPVTISGPGTLRVLQWAKVQAPGFPNVVYKISSLSDTFSSAKIDTTLWNLTKASDIGSGYIYVDTSNSAVAITGRSSNFPITAMSSGNYDATSSALAVRVQPLGQSSSPTSIISNGGFLLGQQGWDTNTSSIQNAGGRFFSYSSDSQDGDGLCGQIATTGAATAQGIEQVITGLQANTTYEFSVWVKKVSGYDPVLTVKDTTNNQVGIGIPVSPVSTTKWVQLSKVLSTGSSGNVSVTVSINTGANSGLSSEFLVDNVTGYSGFKNTITGMQLASSTNSSSNYVSMELSFGSTFLAYSVSNGVTTVLTLKSSYEPVADAFWRIREFAGTVYFETSPDNSNWVTVGSAVPSWSLSSVSASLYAWFSPSVTASLLPAEFSSINSGTNVGQKNAYTSVPNVGGVFLDLLKQAQRRNTCAFVLPTFTNTHDSNGAAWSDTASLVVDNGGDLETQLQASAAAVSADYIMQPGFRLSVGLPGSLGTDRSGTVIFHQSGQMVTSDRQRVRDSIGNYAVASDGTGNLVLATDNQSIQTWNQREIYIESASPTTIQTLDNMVNAALREYKDEQSSRTISVPADLPQRKVFVNYDVGDWIGVQDTQLYNIESVRVVTISVNVDQTENVTVELTLETRIMLLIELMNNLLQKIGASAAAQVLPSPGSVSQVVRSSQSSASSASYTQIVGDGSTTAFQIVHGLGTRSFHVSVWGTASPYSLLTASGNYSVTADSTNQLTITFTSAPTLNQYRVVVSL